MLEKSSTMRKIINREKYCIDPMRAANGTNSRAELVRIVCVVGANFSKGKASLYLSMPMGPFIL